jgi:branched-chain amino acid transport system permease protein
MRTIFKTDYDQDIRLFKHAGYYWSYGTLMLLVLLAPLAVGSYLQSQIVFVFIYAIVGVGLLILVGFTGQASLGHAAFLAIGAYTAAYMQRLGVPFVVYFPLAGAIAGAVGAAVGFPALRLAGIYLVIATIAFGFIVEEVAARWESVTNGNEGLRVKAIEVAGWTLSRDGTAFYYLCLAVLVLVILAALNILRSPTGRAFVALRDSETAARSMGVNLAVYKVLAFSISAAVTGLAGCLYAHKLSFISPEMFTLLLSLEFIIVILIGGISSLHGAVLGAIFVVMVDPFLTLLKDDLPHLAAGIAATLGAPSGVSSGIEETIARVGGAAGLKGAIYGVIIVVFIIFEPYGIYGRWRKLKLYLDLFPLYKKATFRRVKTYVKSERNR